jgi:hypothetical protein
MKDMRNTHFPLLHLYYTLLEKGKLERRNGLCTELYELKLITGKGPLETEFKELFAPEKKDRDKYLKYNTASAYWGKDINTFPECHEEFGSTRQNMLLLYAAYKGEL